MRLSLADVAVLPFSCALFDRNGALLRATPEWRGRALGAVTYEATVGRLVVIPDGSSPDVDALVASLVSELLEARKTMSRRDRLATEMVAAALALVSGRPPAGAAEGSGDEVLEYAVEGIRRSLPGVTVALAVESAIRVSTPAAVGLGLVQLARNANRHRGATRLTLRVKRGPSFRVEWEDQQGAAEVLTSRRPDQRPRWGMGFTRLLADSLGGVVTAPAPVGAGLVGSTIGLGAPRLSAPVALIAAGRVLRASRAWDEETRLAPGAALDVRVARAADAAGDTPGEIAYSDIFRARSAPGGTWLGIAPQSSLGRARDVLRGIQHENALLVAPEPHATRVYALAGVLAAVATGEALDPVPEAAWQRDFTAACSALGLSPNPGLAPGRLRYPDPRVAAFLLSELGGALLEPGATASVEGPVRLAFDAARRDHVLVRLLGGADGTIQVLA